MPRFDDLQQRLDYLSSVGRLRRLVPRRADGAALVLGDGTRLLNFGGNDYLGLSSDSAPFGSGQFADSNAAAARHTASGSGASALVCGWTPEHARLTERLAALEETEAAVLFPTGYAACSGMIAALAEQGDLILSDELNHASLIDGCRLSRADRVVFPHCDWRFVQQTLQARDYRRAWIVTDGVFSMDGHVAPLTELCDVAEQFDAVMIVDEAHGTGVLGEHGSGVCEALGVKERVPVRVGTLSKAIGAQGGFVAGPRVVVDYLVNRCRSLIYSTALAPPAVAAASRALDAIAQHPERRRHVTDLARYLRQRLGLAAGPIEEGVPIVPWILGDDRRAVEVASGLLESGFYVPAIRPPTVPEGTARLRISLSAVHTRAQVDELIAALERLAS